MKNLFIAAAVISLFPALAQATPARDALLGRYHGVQPDGRACHLFIKDVGGKTDMEFMDSMSTRTIRNVGAELEAQLARRSPTLVFKTQRRSLGDVSVHLEILRDARSGKPRAMKGSVAGWLRAEIDCRFR